MRGSDGNGPFPERLNHSPGAIQEALAGAAASHHTVRIKPKGRSTVPIRLAFPPVIAAKSPGRRIKS